VGDADVGRKFRFKSAHLIPEYEPALLHNSQDGRIDLSLVGQVLRSGIAAQNHSNT
jgi:hypothetical protein